MEVIVTNGEISEAEKRSYIKHAKTTFPNEVIEKIYVTLDGENVNLRYVLSKQTKRINE